MTGPQIDQRLDEYRRIRPDPGADPAALAEAALFLEDVFALRLTDEDISEQRLGSFERMRELVYSRLGVA